MLLSHKKKFVFLHIFKTGGTSVTRMLLPYSRLRDRAAYGQGRAKQAVELFNRVTGLQQNGMRHITGYHKFAKAIDVKNKLGDNLYDEFFSFCFVRNPFDRMVSIYFHLKRLPNHPFHHQAVSLEFAAFIEWSLEEQPEKYIDWMVDESGANIVDFVGRLECFDQDVAIIKQRLDLPAVKTLHENSNPSRVKDYRSVYDDNTREIVQSYFAEDLSAFGYDFDGINSDIKLC
jgi:hypothetical protein